MFTAFCLLTFALFKEKPRMIPSRLALTQQNLSQTSIFSDYGKMIKNRNFVLNLIVYIIMFGNYIVLGNCLTPLFED